MAIFQPWISEGIHPWRRWLARSFDMLLVFISLFLLYTKISPWHAFHFVTGDAFGFGDELYIFSGLCIFLGTSAMLTASISVPLNAVFIGLFGSTLGKLLLGIRVLDASAQPMGVRNALRRELKVLMVGLGFEINFVSAYCKYRNYKTLMREHVTPWDKELHTTLRYRPNGAAQIFWVVTVASVCLFVIFALVMSSMYVT